MKTVKRLLLILTYAICVVAVLASLFLLYIMLLISLPPPPAYRPGDKHRLYSNQEYFDRAAVSILEHYEDIAKDHEAVEQFSIYTDYEGGFKISYIGDVILEIEGDVIAIEKFLYIPVEDEQLVRDLRRLFSKGQITDIYVDESGTTVRFVKREHLEWTYYEMLKYRDTSYLYSTEPFTTQSEGYRKDSKGLEFWGKYVYIGDSWFYRTYVDEM